jgi:hypothetical protein
LKLRSSEKYLGYFNGIKESASGIYLTKNFSDMDTEDTGLRGVSISPILIPKTKGVYKSMANEVGKRYKCQKCGAEFIVTRGGKGELYCCSQQMEIKK